eukprot:TRINITY_DN2727_c0_g1_i2.p3 TRINITY_DN2727_c0_g1~~TRINITY_DN2727_c0_g1_i2.p3  ORF type:complete len:424 (+),score=70.23 TRINITY_DN2727_c0_g1_i2:44-1315(+)
MDQYDFVILQVNENKEFVQEVIKAVPTKTEDEALQGSANTSNENKEAIKEPPVKTEDEPLQKSANTGDENKEATVFNELLQEAVDAGNTGKEPVADTKPTQEDIEKPPTVLNEKSELPQEVGKAENESKEDVEEPPKESTVIDEKPQPMQEILTVENKENGVSVADSIKETTDPKPGPEEFKLESESPEEIVSAVKNEVEQKVDHGLTSNGIAYESINPVQSEENSPDALNTEKPHDSEVVKPEPAVQELNVSSSSEKKDQILEFAPITTPEENPAPIPKIEDEEEDDFGDFEEANESPADKKDEVSPPTIPEPSASLADNNNKLAEDNGEAKKTTGAEEDFDDEFDNFQSSTPIDEAPKPQPIIPPTAPDWTLQNKPSKPTPNVSPIFPLTLIVNIGFIPYQRIFHQRAPQNLIQGLSFIQN